MPSKKSLDKRLTKLEQRAGKTTRKIEYILKIAAETPRTKLYPWETEPPEYDEEGHRVFRIIVEDDGSSRFQKDWEKMMSDKR